MKRRPFLKNLTALSGTLAMGSFTSLSAKAYRKLDDDFAGQYKIITASDGHYGQPDTDYESSHSNLKKAIWKEKGTDFIVFNGDLIHDEPRFMTEVKKVYDSIKMPYYVNKGNHDRIDPMQWRAIWGQDQDMGFIHDANFGVVLLNCSNVEGDYLCANLEFLKMKLYQYRELENILVFIHISQNDWTKHGIACDDFLATISEYSNVKATFHGHDHDVDGIMWNRKKPYFWSGHFGGSWGNPFPSYRVIELDESGTMRTALKRVSDGEILNAHLI